MRRGGGGTSLPHAETVPFEERAQQVVKFLSGKPSKRATNREIRESLKMADEDWDSLKLEMKQKGTLASYQTRGGGVRLLTTETSEEVRRSFDALRNMEDEDAFCNAVAREWAEGEFDYVFNMFGELKGSGKWDNPDILAIKLRAMDYLKQKPCNIYGIETKLEFTRQWILQTYSYLRFCHYAYLVVPLTEDEILDEEDGLLAEYATNLGIGVIGLAPAGASPFVEAIQARPHIPSLYELDRFLTNHKEKFKKKKLELDERYFGASLG